MASQQDPGAATELPESIPAAGAVSSIPVARRDLSPDGGRGRDEHPMGVRALRSSSCCGYRVEFGGAESCGAWHCEICHRLLMEKGQHKDLWRALRFLSHHRSLEGRDTLSLSHRMV